MLILVDCKNKMIIEIWQEDILLNTQKLESKKMYSLSNYSCLSNEWLKHFNLIVYLRRTKRENIVFIHNINIFNHEHTK